MLLNVSRYILPVLQTAVPQQRIWFQVMKDQHCIVRHVDILQPVVVLFATCQFVTIASNAVRNVDIQCFANHVLIAVDMHVSEIMA